MSKNPTKEIPGQKSLFDESQPSEPINASEKGTSTEAEAEVSKNSTRKAVRPPADDFSSVIVKLKQALPYVEGENFHWGNVTGLFVIKLSETDSINKTTSQGNSTQIDLTAPATTPPGLNKANDFFPTLVRNETFQTWRINVAARTNNGNIQALKGEAVTEGNQWTPDKIEINRKKNLNASATRSGNPRIHIGFGQDFKVVRNQLWSGDYLIFAKQKSMKIFEIFGLKSNQIELNLRESKVVFTSPQAKDDTTVFAYDELREPATFLKVFNEELDTVNKFFISSDDDPCFEIEDEILVFSPQINSITHRIEVCGIDEDTHKVTFKIKDVCSKPVTLDELKELGLMEEELGELITVDTPVSEVVEPDFPVDISRKETVGDEPTAIIDEDKTKFHKETEAE